jgi:hypothetical protein
MKRLFIVALSSLVLFSSCREIFAKRIRGNGNVIMQERSAASFTAIDVSGNIDVYPKSDSVVSIKVEVDENLQQYIEVISNGGELEIRTQRGFNLRPSRHIKVYVSAPVFTRFDASGACDIIGQNTISSPDEIRIELSGSCDATMEVNAPKISSRLSGACNIKLKGQTKEFNVNGSGSTDIKCVDLLAENVDVHISGAGDAEVYASVSLTGKVSGAADIKYKGNAQPSIKSTGASSVKKVN